MKIKDRIENHIVDDMSLKQIKYLKSVAPDKAEGKLADIYQQVRRDFQLVPPITLFSPDVELLTGLWAISRESQIASGVVSRQDKEAIAAAVSSINTCSYCVDAHVGMLHGVAGHDVANAILEGNTDTVADPHTTMLIEWALASKTPQSKLLANPTFSSKQAPEIIGTALGYHFINRMVSIFLSSSPLPVNTKSRAMRKMATRIFGATAGKSIANKQVDAGESLAFLAEADLPEKFAWSKASPHISKAFAGFSVAMDAAGKKHVPNEVSYLLQTHLSQWHGEDMGLSRQWLEDVINSLDDHYKNIARLVFLTAFTPYQVDESIILAFRKQNPFDNELLAVTCWASYAAMCRISEWIYPVSIGEQND